MCRFIFRSIVWVLASVVFLALVLATSISGGLLNSDNYKIAVEQSGLYEAVYGFASNPDSVENFVVDYYGGDGLSQEEIDQLEQITQTLIVDAATKFKESGIIEATYENNVELIVKYLSGEAGELYVYVPKQLIKQYYQTIQGSIDPAVDGIFELIRDQDVLEGSEYQLELGDSVDFQSQIDGFLGDFFEGDELVKVTDLIETSTDLETKKSLAEYYNQINYGRELVFVTRVAIWSLWGVWALLILMYLVLAKGNLFNRIKGVAFMTFVGGLLVLAIGIVLKFGALPILTSSQRTSLQNSGLGAELNLSTVRFIENLMNQMVIVPMLNAALITLIFSLIIWMVSAFVSNFFDKLAARPRKPEVIKPEELSIAPTI